MILKILMMVAVAIAAILAFVFILAAARPNTCRVQRSVTMDAAPEKIFPLIDSFHNWPTWAPRDTEDS